MRWLSALMPRETRFFALFDRHGALIVEGANAVIDAVLQRLQQLRALR